MRMRWCAVALVATACGAYGETATPAEKQYARLCSGCHGEGATGTERGPALLNNRRLRSRSEEQIRSLIRNGTQAGMPPFALPDAELRSLSRWVHAMNASAWEVKPEGDIEAGARFFFGSGGCSGCHMLNGRGKPNGPDLSDIGKQLTMRDLEESLDNPASRAGKRSSASCPGWAWCPQDPWAVVRVRLRDGAELRGFARGEGKHDIQLQTLDGRFHMLRESEYREIVREKAPFMPALKASSADRTNLLAYLARLGGVTPGALTDSVSVSPAEMDRVLHPEPGQWPNHNGTPGANRHSSLDQINAQNVGRLQLQWSYSLTYSGLEMTPLVSEDVMYVTGPNQVCALDARAGREIWCYSRPRNPAGTISGDAAKGANRGVALLGDRVFFNTDNAHLICLNRITGGLMWDVAMPTEPSPHFGATGAPLVAGNLVISGVGGADEGIRGFVVAYDAATGKEAWRFWTVPKPGEPGSETWKGNAIGVGGGSSWVTGSYDPETGLVFWPTGNPFPDTDGDERKGDNLYTNCVVALDVKTGKLRWYYQFTPHDLHDWDATEPLVLTTARIGGRERKVLLQANRNGFFYVLDRTTGELLLAQPFVKKLTWASGIGKDGRPVLLEGNQPTASGTKTCPAVRGATNWYSTAYNPATALFYVMAVEDCNIYRQSKLGGYVPYNDPSDPPMKYLRALDVATGKIAWEIPQVGAPESNYSGVLSTAGGIVFYGETGGGFAAVDAKTGRTLWHFETNQAWKASPMTYTAKGRQYVAIASGGNVLSFALPEQ